MKTPQGGQWCDTKRHEGEVLAQWMVSTWGIETLRNGSGVIDVGGDPGFLAVALLKRRIPVIVVDPCWGETGKCDHRTQNELQHAHEFASLSACKSNFDLAFIEKNPGVVENASAIVSLYGDEATSPSIQIAARFGKPAVIMPCNECVRFFPQQNPNYDGYVNACIEEGNKSGGRFELVQLHGAPYSRALVAQPPLPSWANNVLSAGGGSITVPTRVLQDMGVLYQVLWQMERSQGTAFGCCANTF